MKIVKLFTISILYFALCPAMKPNQTKDWTRSKYLNTKYLTQYEKVAQDVVDEEGFTHEIFVTNDDHHIYSLFYDPENSNFSVIFCAGWLPGRKEGMLSFYPMLKDQNCSMLFFDARGHGRSTGSVIKSLPWYGENEYKDIIAAVKFVHKRKNNPIYILGLCAGGFNALHAAIELEKEEKIKKYNVKGIIGDSMWSSFNSISYPVPKEFLEEIVAKGLAKLCCCRKYHRTKNTWIKKAASTIITPFTLVLHPIVVRIGFPVCRALSNCFSRVKNLPSNQKTTHLIDRCKKQKLSLPILFIHSQDDPTSPQTIEAIAACCKNASYWLIDKPSKHACNNLIHKEEYRERLLAFFKKQQ